MNYENVVEEFNKKCCKLLVTKEEYNNIIISINRKKHNYRLKYIASCGHEHIVFYNVFKSRNTGIICPSCKNKELGKKVKDKIQNNEIKRILAFTSQYRFDNSTT